MFISANERRGGCYFEFQFCKIKNPVKNGKTNTDVNNWQADSLLIHDDDFGEFYKLYGIFFDCAIFPNGETGFYPYGINYYTPDATLKIYNKLKECIDEKYADLIEWLNEAVRLYNGFYIMGL